MPELPEVETITRQLRSKITGLRIKKIEIKKSRLFVGNPKDIIGLKIQGVSRRAKMIIIDLEPNVHLRGGHGLTLLIHLKMTGQLIYADRKGQFGGGHPVPPFEEGVPNKYTHIIFTFFDNSHLYYNDLRQFGWIRIATNKELKLELKKFGPEPMDKNFTAEMLMANLQKYPRRKIKPSLMDPKIVVGLGNIYAAEICFRAGIMPTRIIATLFDKDYDKLYQAIKEVLPLAIKYKGTSADAYVTLEGKQGTYRDKLWVYGREGLPCPNSCKGKVKKIKLGGRGTYYCEKCQK